MRHAANKEKVAQINAHSPRDSSSTKIGPSPPLGGGLGSRPEASGQDPRCRPLQKRKGQFRCKVVLHSGRVSNSLPSPQFAEVVFLFCWLMVLERGCRVYTRPAQSRNSDLSGSRDYQS